MRICVICGGPIDARRRFNAQTCSTQCSTDLDSQHQNRAAGYRVTPEQHAYTVQRMPHQQWGAFFGGGR